MGGRGLDPAATQPHREGDMAQPQPGQTGGKGCGHIFFVPMGQMSGCTGVGKGLLPSLEPAAQGKGHGPALQGKGGVT